jgi:hypothetical protein
LGRLHIGPNGEQNFQRWFLGSEKLKCPSDTQVANDPKTGLLLWQNLRIFLGVFLSEIHAARSFYRFDASSLWIFMRDWTDKRFSAFSKKI